MIKNKQHMKKFIGFFLIAAAALPLCSCSEEKAEVVDTTGKTGITSVSAKFSSGNYVDDANAVFTATVTDPEQGEILVSIPYYYPKDSDNPVTTADIERMRITAALDEGATVTPGLGLMDLTQENHVEVTLASGAKIKYIIKGAIVKLSECDIESLVLTDPDGNAYDCIIDNSAKTVTASATAESLPNCSAVWTVSPHATLTSPDLTAARTWAPGDKLLVTAQDGTTKEYSFEIAIPQKVDYGIRSGSGTEKWVKYYGTDYGAGTPSLTRLAVSGDYLVVSTGTSIFTVKKTTGAKVADVTVPAGFTVQSLASDDAGHIVFAGNAPFNSTFTVYYVSLDDLENPKVLFTYNHSDIYSSSIGNLRVSGDVTGTAAVTAMVDVSQYYVAWQITGGKASTPVFGAISPATSTIWSPEGACVAPAGATLDKGIYFIGYAGSPYDLYYCADPSNPVWTDEFATGTEGNENYNCITVADFNGAKYLAILQGAHFSWSSAPIAYMFDASVPDQIRDAKVFTMDKSFALTFKDTGACSDVLLSVTSDGYKMHLFWTDGNFDALGCYEFDCIAR